MLVLLPSGREKNVWVIQEDNDTIFHSVKTGREKKNQIFYFDY